MTNSRENNRQVILFVYVKHYVFAFIAIDVHDDRLID